MIRFLAILTLLQASNSGYCCSFVQLGDQRDHASAQNFDFPAGITASLVINKRNVEKSDGHFNGAPSAASAKWVSKYGSLTFGFGPGNPATGVNEAGLRVYRFLLGVAKYPAANTLPAIQESLYVQYLLDTASSIDEVVQQTKAIQIYSPGPFSTHFVICDRSAQCVEIEALGGKLNIHRGSDFKVAALTNTDYPRSIELLKICPTSDCRDIKTNSEWRFVKAATQVKQFRDSDFVKGTFGILNSVNEISPDQSTPTLWTLLTHESSLETQFYVKNTKSSNIIFKTDFKKLDYSCKTAVKVAMLKPEDPGEVALVDYSAGFQAKMDDVLGSYLATSAADVQKWAGYSDKFTRCLE